MLMTVMMVLAVLASCTRSGGVPSVNVSNPGGLGPINALHRVEGPPLDRLSMNQISGIVQTCFAHHDLDDPRVPYTRGYCEKVFAERDRRTLPIPGKRTVIVGGEPVKQVQ
jgi:hypothetical protein